MKYFTHKWNEYINKEWSFYVNCNAFFSFKNSKVLICYDGNYNDKLMEEFEKFYAAKKKYVDMYSYFKQEFGDYQEVELKSYEDELLDYQNRVDIYSNELKKLQKIKDIDFKLLLLGCVDSLHYKEVLTVCDRIFNKANAFLMSSEDYENYLKNYVSKDLLDISLHDSKIIEVIKDGNNLTLKLDDGYYPYNKIYYLTFVNVYSSDIDKMELPISIMDNSIYYNNNKYYYYLEGHYYDFYEFVCDDVLLEVKYK